MKLFKLIYKRKDVLIFFAFVLYLSYLCSYYTLKTIYEHNNKDLVYLNNKK